MTTAPSTRAGILEIHRDGHGYIRDPNRGYKASHLDPYVSERLIDRLRIRPGSAVVASIAQAEFDETPRVSDLLEINGRDPVDAGEIRQFEELTAVDPSIRIRLESPCGPMSLRVLDLISPIGKGHRGLIVAPPRSGKTILLQEIAKSVTAQYAEIELVVLLLDERPEEVTEIRRGVNAQVVASSNDQPAEEHVRLAELTFDRARRVVEQGGDVLILLDSLTRLARAYNTLSSTGRTLTGGVDLRALDSPKRLFGSARAFDQGGSLTVLGSCLVQTGSKMDDVIFQEFKGTGNLEIVLDRKLADHRIWPAIDISQSGSRKEERLLDAAELSAMRILRRSLASMEPREAIESLLARLGKFETNSQLVAAIGT
jgi:transcription termination factor Rho